MMYACMHDVCIYIICISMFFHRLPSNVKLFQILTAIRIASSSLICACQGTSHRFRTAMRYAATRRLRSLAASPTTDRQRGSCCCATIDNTMYRYRYGCKRCSSYDMIIYPEQLCCG